MTKVAPAGFVHVPDVVNSCKSAPPPAEGTKEEKLLIALLLNQSIPIHG
jgi:hypothetical protein